MKKLRLYLGGLAAIVALGATPALEVRAEDEILYVETEDDYHTEDTESITVPANSDTTTQVVVPTSDAQPSLTEQPKEEKEEEFDPNRTDIDPDDQEYNTGREEIPDSVPTEWERKFPTPDKPTPTPDKPTPTPDQPTPDQPTPVQPTPVQPTPVQPIPKTGTEDNSTKVALSLSAILLGIQGIYRVRKSKRKYSINSSKSLKRN